MLPEQGDMLSALAFGPRLGIADSLNHWITQSPAKNNLHTATARPLVLGSPPCLILRPMYLPHSTLLESE